ncbi:MAG: DUF2304 family protein [Solirubrobacteraceae bacterium]|nr:DUF2304 family protein [Solirubrobacteraceae bacterium]
MSTQLRIIAIIVSLGLFLSVIELVRRRRLMERYALLWLTATVALTGLSIWSGLLDRISSAIGVRYGTSTLFAVAFGFLTLMVLHFTLVISRLVEQNKILAQKMALLQGRLDRLESDPAVAPGPEPRADSPERAPPAATGRLRSGDPRTGDAPPRDAEQPSGGGPPTTARSRPTDREPVAVGCDRDDR